MPRTRKSTGTRRRKFITEQDCVGVYEFARITGYSYKHIYECCRMGTLEARYERGLWLIPNEVLHRVLTEIVPFNLRELDFAAARQGFSALLLK